MGIDTGAAQARDGDFYGPVVNRAARLMSVAHGGQIVVSAASRGLLDETDFDLVDLGAHRLRDLARPVRVFQVVIAGLPCEFTCDFPCDFELGLPFVFEPAGHAPIVSP